MFNIFFSETVPFIR